MRLTTKIFIGFIISILAIILIFMFYLKSRETESYPFQALDHKFEDATQAIQLQPYSVVYIDRSDAGLSLEGSILNHAGNANELLVNKDLVQYTNIDVRNDTLFININTDKILKELESKVNPESSHYGYPRAYGAKIRLPQQKNMHIVKKLSFDIYMDSLNIDTLKLMASEDNNITINASKVKTFTFDSEQSSTNMTFKFINSHIGEWNIDAQNLDSQYSEFESSVIEVLNIRGEGECKLPYLKYNKLNWLPLNEESTLNIQLQKATSIEMKQ